MIFFKEMDPDCFVITCMGNIISPISPSLLQELAYAHAHKHTIVEATSAKSR